MRALGVATRVGLAGESLDAWHRGIRADPLPVHYHARLRLSHPLARDDWDALSAGKTTAPDHEWLRWRIGEARGRQNECPYNQREQQPPHGLSLLRSGLRFAPAPRCLAAL